MIAPLFVAGPDVGDTQIEEASRSVKIRRCFENDLWLVDRLRFIGESVVWIYCPFSKVSPRSGFSTIHKTDFTTGWSDYGEPSPKTTATTWPDSQLRSAAFDSNGRAWVAGWSIDQRGEHAVLARFDENIRTWQWRVELDQRLCGK